MPRYYDIYGLAPRRDIVTLRRFLDDCAPAREESASEYAIPQHAAEPEVVYTDSDAVIVHLMREPHREHAIYWRCLPPSRPAHVMAFFTGDGGLVVGVSVEARLGDEPDHDGAEIVHWLTYFRERLGVRHGYALFETPPDSTSIATFLEVMEVVAEPKLVDGVLTS